jgi:peptidyl-prolyl cis-trans isomerase C
MHTYVTPPCLKLCDFDLHHLKWNSHTMKFIRLLAKLALSVWSVYLLQACQEYSSDTVSNHDSSKQTVQTELSSKMSSNKNHNTTQNKSMPEVTSYQDNSLVLAQVGPVKITKNMLEKHLEKMSPFNRSRYQSADRLQELLDSLIRFELLALAAKTAGHDQHPDVILAHKQSMVRTLLKEDLRKNVHMSDIKDEAVADYYQNHLADYQRAKQVRAAHILLKDEAKAKQVLKQLQQQIQQNPSQAQGLFTYQVKLHSQDLESKNKRGDLQYFTLEGTRIDTQRLPQSLPAQSVVQAAFTLKTLGDLYPQVVASKKGYHLIQKIGERRALNRDLASVAPEIKNILFKVKKQKMMETYLADLKRTSQIKVFNDRLTKLKLRPSPYTSSNKNKAIKKLMNQSLDTP